MKFREFFNESRFELIQKGNSNWDYYKMITLTGSESVVALAKEGTGCQDSTFGNMKHFEKIKATYSI